MTFDESLRIAALRERLFRCVEDELNRGDGHKSYEGAMDITMSLPNIFEREKPPEWAIVWHCYVVTDHGRHFSWTGSTLAEAIAVAESAVDKIALLYEMERFERNVDACCDEPGEEDGSTTIYGRSRDSTVRNPND